MAHNFQRHLSEGLPVANCAFVSKAGSDANDGLTPDTPKLTILAGCQVGQPYVIIGDGTYRNEQLGTSCAGKSLYGDGTVICIGDAGLSFGDANGQTTRFFSLNIFKYDSLPGGYTNNQLHCYYYACVLTGGSVYSSGYGRTYFYDCILKNVVIGDNTALSSGILMYRCIARASTIDTRAALQYCYFDEACAVSVRDNAAAGLGGNDASYMTGSVNCNVRCPITVNGTTYNDLAALQAALGTSGVFSSSINAEPRFNLPTRDDYSLRFTSPHLATGIGPRHLRYAQVWYIASSAAVGEKCTTSNTWLVNSADNSIVTFLSISGFSWSGQGSLYITENADGIFEASYRTSPLQVATVAQVIKRLPVLTGLNFDTSNPVLESQFNSALPDILNNNVPSRSNFVSGAAGRNPHRLTIGMRWSTAQAPQDGNNSQWVTGAKFLPFQINAEPQWNQASGLGNGEPDFDVTRPQPIQALWVQFEYTARNNQFDR